MAKDERYSELAQLGVKLEEALKSCPPPSRAASMVRGYFREEIQIGAISAMEASLGRALDILAQMRRLEVAIGNSYPERTS